MKLENLWTEQSPRPDDLLVAEQPPASVDVVIVGSGYTGLTAAITLAKSGASVAVLEAETIGWGASSRNGGITSPGQKKAISKIFKAYGPEKGRALWQISLDAIDLIERYIQEENIDCGWHRDGYVALAYKPSHYDHLREYAEWVEKHLDYPTTLVPPAELGSEIGTDKFYGGLSDPNGGGLQPAQYVFGLAQAAARHGAFLCEETQVTGVKRREGGFEVVTNRGVVRAGEVVFATNGYTENVVPGLKSKVFPVGSYIIVTEPLTEDLQREISPRQRMFWDTKSFLNYFGLTHDGRMLWGGRNDLSTNLDLEVSAGILREQMVETFPQLAGIPVTHTWTGKLGITFDLMPHIGRVKGVHYALGYGGHGMAGATYLGTEIGLRLSGQKKASLFEDIPHQTYFFYRNRPWFIPFAAMWYRFQDSIS